MRNLFVKPRVPTWRLWVLACVVAVVLLAVGAWLDRDEQPAAQQNCNCARKTVDSDSERK